MCRLSPGGNRGPYGVTTCHCVPVGKVPTSYSNCVQKIGNVDGGFSWVILLSAGKLGQNISNYGISTSSPKISNSSITLLFHTVQSDLLVAPLNEP
jgi:hypothetical protein